MFYIDDVVLKIYHGSQHPMTKGESELQTS